MSSVMDISEKISILAEAARYDVSCASSGSNRKKGAKLGNTSIGGICHSWSDDGRCISLLKLLMSNYCIYDCAYCVNRKSNDIKRATFTPDEIVNLTVSFYKRNYIEGLFLSSGILVSPDYTMEKMIEIAEKLRKNEGFGGYIHMKAIPGASQELIQKAGFLADRISVNIELPSEQSLIKLAPDKSKNSIIKPMSFIGKNICENRTERKKHKKIALFAPAGQSTQMIIGASPENDKQVLKLSNSLYENFHLKRVYYSAYVPVGKEFISHNFLPPLLREHRLYQADWLMRFYNFNTDEILTEDNPFLDDELDPKCAWALRNPQIFPVNINTADKNLLLRVPGIGVRGAEKIISSRKFSKIRFEDLYKFGIVLKRAKFFISCDGYHFSNFEKNIPKIKSYLINDEKENLKYEQMELPLK
ncbi:MAG TPA: putative DNA modification/repair radical SAM protein, partial [Victivallales bacterium]|nr:putative DNA modification/repair radical SAM protein [Victivallales bacterium]